MKLHRILGACGMIVALAAPALAQDMPGANGRWWPTTRDGFAFGNPFQALYLRAGLGVDLSAFGAPRNAGCGPFGSCPPFVGNPDSPATRASLAGVAAIGGRIAPALRIELAASFGPMQGVRANGVASGDPVTFEANVRSMQVMGNLYLDFAPWLGATNFGAFNPYIMGGVGVAINSLNRGVDRLNPDQPVTFYYPSGQNADFAWQIGAGLQWQAGNFMILDLGYSYLDAGSARSGSGTVNCTVAPGPDIILCIPPGDGARVRVPIATHRVMLSIIIPFEGLTGR